MICADFLAVFTVSTTLGLTAFIEPSWGEKPRTAIVAPDLVVTRQFCRSWTPVTQTREFDSTALTVLEIAPGPASPAWLFPILTTSNPVCAINRTASVGITNRKQVPGLPLQGRVTLMSSATEPWKLAKTRPRRRSCGKA